MTFLKTRIFNSVQNTLLAIIATCLFLIVIKLNTPNAYADDSYIIERILFCIDGSRISGDRLSTYCNR
tara:strand:- start:399 stop:602 length:204 start_codon:yes stop_codon:yes gene_type:complete